MPRHRIVFVFFILVVLIAQSVWTQVPMRNFTLKTVNGEDLSLSDFGGSVVLLTFWKTNCNNSKKQLLELTRLQETYRRYGFIVYAIALDQDIHKVRQFTNQNRIHLVTMMDNEQKVAELYQIKKTPTTYLVGKNGLVRFAHSGFSLSTIQKIEKELVWLLREPKNNRAAEIQTAKIE